MSQTTIPLSLRHSVIEQAQDRCEYCRIHQNFSPYTHEVDHLLARKHGGKTLLENLALACLPCNRRKGSDLTTIDPNSGELVSLFNPRLQNWDEHFALQGAYIVGITAIGRATVFLLNLNASSRLIKRQLLIVEGVYP